MTELKNGTWVLVADGEKALFLENVTDGKNPHLKVRRHEAQANPANRVQGSDAPGRVQSSAGTGAHAYEETDWHRLEKDRFADHMAGLLYEAAHRGAFERLVIVAPPAVLGALRASMHEEVSGKVVGEIHKTLTNHTLSDIEKILRADLAG
jgi:protein required for attachment to host cells